MQNRAIVARSGTRWRRLGCGVGLFLLHRLPSALTNPAFEGIAGTIESDIAHGISGLLRLVNYSGSQCHGTRPGLVDAGIVKAAISENRDWNQAGGNLAAGIGCKLEQRSGPQFVRVALKSCSTQRKHTAGYDQCDGSRKSLRRWRQRRYAAV